MSKFDDMKLMAEEIDMLNRDSMITDQMADITAKEASEALAAAMRSYGLSYLEAIQWCETANEIIDKILDEGPL